jgi:hypothetical protein
METEEQLLAKEIRFFQSHFGLRHLLGIFLLRTLRGFIALFLGARHFLLSFLERSA